MTPKETAKTKILLCEPMPDRPGAPPPHRAWWQKTVELVARPGTTLDCVAVKKGYMGLSTYEQAYNAIQMVQRAYEAEKKGYDAFIIGCASDMGLKECRALVNIPVVAPTEATALLASTLGDKFSIIDLQPFTRPVIENAIKSCGLIDKLASIRCPPGLTAQKSAGMMVGGEQEKLTELFTAEMARAVNEDGAEALFVSCVVTSSMINMQGVHEVNGVPVIEPISASLKLAETLVDLKRAYGLGVCKRSIYCAPSPGWEQQIPIIVD